MTDQINRDRGEKWLAVSLPCKPHDAYKKFKSKFGYEPKEISIHKKYLLVGPVEEDND